MIKNVHFYVDIYNMTPMEVRTGALETVEEPIQYPIKENKRIQKYYDNLMNKQECYATA